MALIRDPAEHDVMRRSPRDPAEALVTWRFGARILGEGALLAAGVLTAYLRVVWNEGPGAAASTMAFTALVLIHPFQAMSCRSRAGQRVIIGGRLRTFARALGLRWRRSQEPRRRGWRCVTHGRQQFSGFLEA